MSWHRAGVLLLGAQSCLPVPGVPAVGGIGSMAGSVTRRGLDMTGFVLELRGMCVVLGYPHGVDYQARPLPEQEGEDAEPHAGWEVTAVILSGSPERTSLAVTAGGDSFPAACQNAALLAIGTLHQRYPDELQHSPYRYHPRRGGARDYATFRDASSEDDATVVHLARMVEAYDAARIDFHQMVRRGMVENNMKILELRQENLQLKKDLDAMEAQLHQLKIAQGEDSRPKHRRVCRSQKITARKSTSRPELVRQSLAWTCFVETPRAEPAPVVPQEGEASGVGSSEGALLLTFRPGPSQRSLSLLAGSVWGFQMVTTRRNVNTGEGNQPEGSNPNPQGNPPPPPPPDTNAILTQILAQQANMMNTFLHHLQNPPQQNAPPPPPQHSKLAEFLRIRPPTFSSSNNPVDALDWLHAVGKKLDTVQCSDEEKVIFAAHQLQGPASLWWDHFQATQPEGQPITWARFTAAFRRTHVPAGVVALKKREFRELKQGNRSVMEYLHEFNNLARYAPEDVREDEEKQEKFLAGMDPELSVRLVSGDYPDFQRLVDKSIRLEAKHKELESHKRRLANFRNQQGANQRVRYTNPYPGGSSSQQQQQQQPRPAPRPQFVVRVPQPQQQQNQQGTRAPRPPTPTVQPVQGRRDASGPQRLCFNCFEPGHFADKCPKPRRQQGQAPPRSNNGGKDVIRGRVNHVTAEDVLTTPDVIVGTFLVHSIPATILFDSGASHSFISVPFVGRNQLGVERLRNPLLITTPGGVMTAKYYSPAVPIEIQGIPFPSDLILLDTKNLDVILGMNWLAQFQGVVDCARRTVTLYRGPEQPVVFFAPPTFVRSSELHQISLSEIPIVREFGDVFPEELPGMPPKREIEFRIDLAPGTTPLYKRPYPKPTLLDQIREAQKNDPDMHGLLKNMKQGKAAGFTEDEHGTLWNGKRVCVPDSRELKQLILQEAHESPYSIHPGSTKMYLDLKEKYWWVSMKREIAEFVALCDVCQRVKAEHQRPAGLLQPLQVPEWKWDEIGMDFITGLPKTQGGYDSIWVIVDRLTKVARFIPVKTTYGGNKLAELYFARVVSLHGVPKKIVSDRGSQFTSHFWKKLQEELGTRLNFSTAYHPQTDGQTERLNQILEDMLRACVLDFGKTWDKSLPYAEFSYNNSYQASIQMAPYEALYGRKCRTPLLWDQVGESQVFGTDILREAEAKVRIIRDNLKVAQSRQKSYADNRRRDLEFAVDDFVYLRVTPLRGVHRFQTKGKLAPRYVGPFRIIARRGEVAYQLELPASLGNVHDVFHVSQLKKCLRVPSEQADSEQIEVREDLTYVERPVKILDTMERRTRNRVIRFCKVQWSNHAEEEATWEREDELKAAHPDLFASSSESRGRDSV
uniref:OSJNBa0004L19.17 protein n=1 Tax=Oryza sativa subsp. japonica TaxID=39947 RepID=Q5JPZ7_ORYSJ|nr:OSJNBa0004L19.17 [Oryza sativa Japonica Group]